MLPSPQIQASQLPTKAELKQLVREASRGHHKELNKPAVDQLMAACTRSKSDDVCRALMWRMENCHQKPHKLWLSFQVLETIASRQYDLVADHMNIISQEVAAGILSQFGKKGEVNQKAFTTGVQLLKSWDRVHSIMHVAEFLPGMGTDTRRSMRRALDDLVGGTTVASSPAGMASAYSSNSTRAAHEKLMEAEQHAHLLLEMVARRDTHGEQPEILNEVAAACKSYRIRITEMITRATNNTDQPGMEQVMAKLLDANETLNKALEAYHTPGSLQATPKASVAEGANGFAPDANTLGTEVAQEAAPANVPAGSPMPDAGTMLMDLLGGEPAPAPSPAPAAAVTDPFAPAAPTPVPAAVPPASNPFAEVQQPPAVAAPQATGQGQSQEWNAFFDSRTSQ